MAATRNPDCPIAADLHKAWFQIKEEGEEIRKEIDKKNVERE
jgi:hypothetical protein